MSRTKQPLFFVGGVRQTGLSGYYDEHGIRINHPLAGAFDPTYTTRYSEDYDHLSKIRDLINRKATTLIDEQPHRPINELRLELIEYISGLQVES